MKKSASTNNVWEPLCVEPVELVDLDWNPVGGKYPRLNWARNQRVETSSAYSSPLNAKSGPAFSLDIVSAPKARKYAVRGTAN